MEQRAIMAATSNAEIVNGRDVLAASIRDEWAAYISDRAPATVRTYQNNIKAFLTYCDGKGIYIPTRQAVVDYRAEMEAQGVPASTRQARLNALRSFFGWAAEQGLYEDITKGVKRVKVSAQHKEGWLTPAQVKHVLESIDRGSVAGLRDYAMISLLAFTGIRQVEACRANIGDLMEIGGSYLLAIQRKGQQEKGDFVKVPATVVKALRAYIAARPDASPEQPLFIGHGNNCQGKTARMLSASTSRAIRQRLEAAGVKEEQRIRSAHCLRHTFAMICLENKVSLQELKSLMGHSNIATTMIYVDERAKQTSTATEDVAAAVFAA